MQLKLAENPELIDQIKKLLEMPELCKEIK
jgi:hypothetical protein